MELSRGQSSPEVQQQMQQPEPTQQREAQIQQTREQVDQHSQHPKMAQELDKYTPQQQEAIKQSIAEDAANVGRGNTKIDLLGMKDQNTIVGRVNQAFYFETNIPQALDKAQSAQINSQSLPETDKPKPRPGIDEATTYTIKPGDSLAKIGQHLSPDDAKMASAISMATYVDLQDKGQVKQNRSANRMIMQPGDQVSVDMSQFDQSQVNKLANSFDRYQTAEHREDVRRDQVEQARQELAQVRAAQARAAQQQAQQQNTTGYSANDLQQGLRQSPAQSQGNYAFNPQNIQHSPAQGLGAQSILAQSQNSSIDKLKSMPLGAEPTSKLDQIKANLQEAKTDAKSYWEGISDKGVENGSFIQYAAGQVMGTIASGSYSVLNSGIEAGQNPKDAGIGVIKGVVNFGPNAFNGATNLTKTAADGLTLLAEEGGLVKNNTFKDFRSTQPYNIETLTKPKNDAEAFGAGAVDLASGYIGTRSAIGRMGVKSSVESAPTLSHKAATVSTLDELGTLGKEARPAHATLNKAPEVETSRPTHANDAMKRPVNSPDETSTAALHHADDAHNLNRTEIPLNQESQLSTGNTNKESVHIVSNSTFNIEEIRFKLKTEPNTAYFWSGRTEGVGGADNAASIALNRGGVTLETTLSSKQINMPEWNFNDASSMKAWDEVSAAYAEQVSGEIKAVIGKELREGNIWENVELPRLKSNPKVTKITTIDPKTGLENILFNKEIQ